MSLEDQLSKIISALPSSSEKPIFAFFILGSDKPKVTAKTMAMPKLGGSVGE